MNIILASKSPRRRELLGRLGISFTVQTADIDETMDETKTPQEEVERVCRKKAEYIAAKNPDALVIAADTVVVCGGEILGKPKDAADARRMLTLLSDATHEVMTGYCVSKNGHTQSAVSISKITFRKLTAAEIEAYIASGEPMDKAGSYGIQGLASLFVSHVSGDFYAVMGLPICPLCEMLRARGVSVFA